MGLPSFLISPEQSFRRASLLCDRTDGAGSVEERLVATYKLTKSELAVTRLVADGMSNKEIAALVDVKERTVEFHMTNIIQKLRVSNRTGVAVRVKELE